MRFIDVFVDSLDLAGAGFERAEPKETGCPRYDPADLLKLHLYGYLNRVRSSRRLEAETHRGIRLPWDRNCELAFVNLLRQLDADNDTSRIVERFEPQHRSQSPLHPAVVVLHNVIQVLTATNSHRFPPPEVGLPVHSHAP